MKSKKVDSKQHQSFLDNLPGRQAWQAEEIGILALVVVCLGHQANEMPIFFSVGALQSCLLLLPH